MNSDLKVLISNTENPVHPGLMNSMFRLRHETFGERLKWEVSSENGLEMDRFDKEDSCYVMATVDGGNVLGCWRFLPTTGDYMLKDVFPELAKGEEIPVDESVWEISRFAIDYKSSSRRTRRGVVGHVTMEIIRNGIEFGRKNNVKAFVFVTTVAFERVLKTLGIKARRFGNGESTMIGNVDSVALWLDLDEELNRAVH